MMDPILGAGLVKGGLGLAQGLFNLWGQDNYARDQQRRGLGMLNSQYGQLPYDPGDVLAGARQARLPEQRKLGEKLDRTLGLDAGSGQGAYGTAMLGADTQLFSDAYIKAMLEKHARDFQIANATANYKEA